MQKSQHNNKFVQMGRIIGIFGIKGWVKIKPDTQEPGALSKYSGIYIFTNGKYVFYKLADSFVKNGIFHAKFDELSDRDVAIQLKGVDVAVAREDFPEPESDEYYWVDLIGLEVWHDSGVYLGKVTDLMETGSNSVLVVEIANGSSELIPFVDVFVSKVDLGTKKITVCWELEY